jgi:hypothetical protein
MSRTEEIRARLASSRALELVHAWAPTDLAWLLDEVAQLRQALAYYAEATVVGSWGMQELADDGQVARRALGLPEPDPRTLAERLGVVYGGQSE